MSRRTTVLLVVMLIFILVIPLRGISAQGDSETAILWEFMDQARQALDLGFIEVAENFYWAAYERSVELASSMTQQIIISIRLAEVEMMLGKIDEARSFLLLHIALNEARDIPDVFNFGLPKETWDDEDCLRVRLLHARYGLEIIPFIQFALEDESKGSLERAVLYYYQAQVYSLAGENYAYQELESRLEFLENMTDPFGESYYSFLFPMYAEEVIPIASLAAELGALEERDEVCQYIMSMGGIPEAYDLWRNMQLLWPCPSLVPFNEAGHPQA